MTLTVTIHRHIAAAPDRVFATITDIPNTPTVISAIASVALLTDGPVGPGTRWRETRRLLGHAATETLEDELRAYLEGDPAPAPEAQPSPQAQ